MVAPRALVFRPLVKGNEDSGNEIEHLLYSQSRDQYRFETFLHDMPAGFQDLKHHVVLVGLYEV